jgi:catechol 2,3-dioxygenase-like lactoylglutathione lyase family enzyme
MMKNPEAPRLFRVLLQVSNLELSQRFYESLLGTPGRRVGGGRIYFDSGPVLLALLDATADGETRVSPLPEPLYLATSDLEGVYRRARGLGCLASSLIHHDPKNPAGEIVVRPWGERSFYAADPSGNPLCFVDEGTLFTGTPRQAREWNRAYRRSSRRRPSTRARRRRPSEPRKPSLKRAR